VRLIDVDGRQLGIVTLREARGIAAMRGLDLIEVAPQADPPVCKIMDYGKYRYEQSKRQREHLRKRRATELKILRLRPSTDEHDLETKRRQAETFLRQGHKVQFSLFFRGREITHHQLGREMLERVAEELQAVAEVARRPSLEGRQMTMILTPRADLEALEAATAEED